MAGRDELRCSAKAGRQIRIEVMSAYVLRGGTRLKPSQLSVGAPGDRTSPPPNNNPGQRARQVKAAENGFHGRLALSGPRKTLTPDV